MRASSFPAVCLGVHRTLAAAVLALCALPAAAATLEEALPALRDAAARGNVAAVAAARAQFARHPLEAYPHYWVLAATLERAERSEVREFLARHAGSPLAETLRRDWLRVLGAAGAWEDFRAEYSKLTGEDAEITCFAFQERLLRGDREVEAEARRHFLAGREAPASCDAVFAAIAASDRLSEADAWERLRKLLAAGLVKDAKRANALIAPARRLNERLLERAATDPAGHFVRDRSAALTRAGRELALFAIGRLARIKPDVAAERAAALEQRLGSEMAAAAWAQVAWQAALSHHPRALEWYARAASAPLTDTQLAWRARAALRAGDWKTLLASIQAMSPEEARDASWRYWRARALRALGSGEAAQALLKAMAGEPGFYGLLAADEIGALPAPDWSGWQPQPADLERARANAGIERALLLYRVGLDNEAFREWVHAIRGLGDRELLAASQLARAANVSDRAINTAERTVQLHDFSQRYPMPHREALAAAARQWDLDEALVYSIIRQESRFMPEARSRVGATGLMQLMPATARWVAKQIPVSPYKPQMLLLPDVNIHMGSYYLRRVLLDLRHPMLATAAYNAGPGRARRWRGEQPLEGAIYAETIPFNETRDYVKKVFANAWYYRHRLTGKPPGLREMLGAVPGRHGEPPDAAFASIIP